MAKVMISLPDELLRRIDSEAAAKGTSRSATVRALAEAGLGGPDARWQEAVDALERHAKPRGGNVAALIREDRER